MWLKSRRMNAVLAPLASLVDGGVADGRLTGTYHGFTVEARPRTGLPLQRPPTSRASTPGQVDMFRLTLSGVHGRAIWHCQSSPSSVWQDAVSRFTAGPLLRGFGPGDFKFERVDTWRDAQERRGAKLAKAVGVPMDAAADQELQDRLIAAGLLEELATLRWGAHPYLPKASFTPPGGELLELYKHSPAFARVQPGVTERLRAAGYPDFESLLNERMADADASSPGELLLELEVGKAKAPPPERFRELLDRAVRIAKINAEANPPTHP